VEERRFVGRRGIVRRLRAIDGEPGRSVYADGVARFEREDEILAVRPPFGLAHSGAYDRVRTGPLVEELEADRLVAVLLVRLGGYAVGVLEGERVVASKVGTRFVKGRHRAGGSSSGRFARRREEQARALHEDAAETAASVLGPWRDRVAHAALGGDRAAVRAALGARPELAWLERIALPRFFTVPDPRLRVLERLPYDLYAAEVETGTAARRGERPRGREGSSSSRPGSAPGG
jgi:hypothetical protein